MVRELRARANGVCSQAAYYRALLERIDAVRYTPAFMDSSDDSSSEDLSDWGDTRMVCSCGCCNKNALQYFTKLYFRIKHKLIDDRQYSRRAVER